MTQPSVLCLKIYLLEYIQLLEDLDQGIDAAIYLLLGMGSHQRKAYKGILRCTSRRYHRIDEYSFLRT